MATVSSSSRSAENLPTTARSIALLLSATPSVQDAQPGVLHQLLEFSHRYTAQVLTDASVYAEHAGRGGKVEMDDVTLAVQARVGWEFGGRVPKEVERFRAISSNSLMFCLKYILSLANDVNASPLPVVPEVFGVRLPPQPDCLTNVDFNLIPNKPPPDVKIYDEVEEVEESESEEEESEQDEDEDMEPASVVSAPQPVREEAPFPISAIATPSDIDMFGTPAAGAGTQGVEEGSDAGEEEDGLFAGGDEEEESDGMEEVQTAPDSGEAKRKLVEEDDYD
ncbi:Transcription initiation factor TFIID subunit 9 [Leucoagaricus sp. SymC.cos]|nr:Transcription initiation factor TFIID subunit 9 [Leucoagaricus sp. SymC.cos]